MWKCDKVRIQTLYDGQEDDDDKEEESDIKNEAEDLIWVSRSRFEHISYPSSSSQPFVNVVYETL